MGDFGTILNMPVKRRRKQARRRLKKLDKRMARVCEGLVDLLIIKGVISEKDLNPEVRRLMAERHSLRTIMKV